MKGRGTQFTITFIPFHFLALRVHFFPMDPLVGVLISLGILEKQFFQQGHQGVRTSGE